MRVLKSGTLSAHFKAKNPVPKTKPTKTELHHRAPREPRGVLGHVPIQAPDRGPPSQVARGVVLVPCAPLHASFAESTTCLAWLSAVGPGYAFWCLRLELILFDVLIGAMRTRLDWTNQVRLSERSTQVTMSSHEVCQIM